MHSEAVTLPSMRTSWSCTSWKPPMAAELLPFGGVAQGVLVGAPAATHGLPGDAGPGHAQHVGGVAEGAGRWRRMDSGTRTPSSVMTAFCTARRAILCSIFSVEKPGVSFSTRKPFTLPFVDVAGPDDGDVGEGGVADPLLGAVEDPGVAGAIPRETAGGGGEAAGGAGADVGFGQAEGADLLHPGHRREPLRLLLLRAAQVDRPHGQAAVDAMKVAIDGSMRASSRATKPSARKLRPGQPWPW